MLHSVIGFVELISGLVDGSVGSETEDFPLILGNASIDSSHLVKTVIGRHLQRETRVFFVIEGDV